MLHDSSSKDRVLSQIIFFFGASSEKSKKKMTAKMEIKLCRYGMDELVQMCGTSVITTLNASNAAGAVRTGCKTLGM